MYTLQDSVALLRAAESTLASKLLSADEQLQFLDEIVSQIPHEFSRSKHVAIVYAAIKRAQEQRRPTKRKQDATPVAEGTDEAAEGSSEGLKEQAENSGRSADADADSAPIRTSSSEAKVPKAPTRRANRPR